MIANMYGVSFWSDENVIELVVMVSYFWMKTIEFCTLKRCFMVCELYFNF